MTEFYCPSCDWSVEREPTADIPIYCPECGDRVTSEIHPSSLSDVETQTDTL